eukprot:gene14610-17275_t
MVPFSGPLHIDKDATDFLLKISKSSIVHHTLEGEGDLNPFYNFLSLEKGSCFPFFNDQKIFSTIFVRDCYPKMYKIIMSLSQPTFTTLVRDTKRTRMDQSATLGEAMPEQTMTDRRRPRNIVVHTIHHHKIFIFIQDAHGADSVYWYPIDSPLSLIAERFLGENDIYIIDSVVPIVCKSYKILLTSPDPSIYKKATKQNAYKLWMPTWDKNEINICHKVLFSQIPTCDVKVLYDHWGGIARYVLTNWLTSKTSIEDLSEAINKVDFGALVRAVGSSSANDTISHKIIHVIPVDDGFEKKTVKVTDFRKGHGILFQSIADNVLSSGGAFPIRRLHQPSTIEFMSKSNPFLKLESAQQVVFSENGEKDIVPGLYSLPPTTNYPAIDAIIKGKSGVYSSATNKIQDIPAVPTRMFQMTVSQKHPVAYEKFLAFLKTADLPKPLELYFVVPEDTYKDFTYQRYKMKKDVEKDEKKPTATKAIKNLDPIVASVKQFVLEIKYGVMINRAEPDFPSNDQPSLSHLKSSSSS